MMNNKITEGTIWKQAILFFIPILFGTFFQHLYTIVDAVIVGRGLGTAELAAVGGSAAKYIAMITNFFIGISIGVTAYASRSYGEKNFKKLKAIIFNGTLLFVCLGLIFSIIGIVFSFEFLNLMGTPKDNIDLSNTYLKTYLYGILFCVIYNLFTGILRAMGDSKRPLYILMFCSILNIILDLLLALVLGLGVFGVAIATVFSQGVSAVLLFILLLRSLENTEHYKLSVDFPLMKDVAILGIPAGIQSILASFSNMAVQSTVNTFSTMTVAAWSAYIKLDGIVDAFISALSGSVITFVGQNLGAGKIDRVKKSVKQITIIGYMMMPIIIAVFILNRFTLLSMFTTDQEVVATSANILLFVIPMYIVTIPQYLLSQAVRGLGKSIMPMLLGLFGSVGLRLLWIFVIFPYNPTIEFLGLSYPVISFIMSILFFAYYRIVVNRLEYNKP
ncbi:MATE family efflux transporter [Vallitalea pronyensis]|uniref:Probable multidrug resistance protein NorM n=1 Tax=Vallitalea pronyensis TaxID=1348613 RepID=A0A8J8SJD5_9FIRM|nr:MATE family efflux transporter [Vallitalea pronyensis]QUI25409.1 MATE family efflux transporter [Vallitalea pronyensis]